MFKLLLQNSLRFIYFTLFLSIDHIIISEKEILRVLVSLKIRDWLHRI